MTERTEGRRHFIRTAIMWCGVAAGYGIGAVHFLRYLVPLGGKVRYREMFVGSVDDLAVGQSKTVRTPAGDSFVMARTKTGFRVLSDVCPHLGCRVHWQREENRFLCPCHMGIFDAEGRAISGPPAEANQDLARLETVIRGKSVFVMIKES
ncbi:MAG: QcrA and Rieske domain-containing protein [Planctomycetota bacterium]|jgi:cytochrome b6-f complex iron-sulfur subunit